MVKVAQLLVVRCLKILQMKGPISLGIDIAEKVLALESLSVQDKLQQIIRARLLRRSGRTQGGRSDK